VRIATLSNASVIHTRRWVEHFRARGHEVRVWSLETGPPELGAESLPRVPAPGFLRYPLAAPALRGALRAFAPDLVDAHFVPNYGLLGVLSGRRPLSVAAWGSDLLVTGAATAAQAWRTRFVLGRADLVLADARNLGAAARALGAVEARLRVIPWGIDLARFQPGTSRDPERLVTTRMHEPVYDVPTLLRGVAPALERRPRATLVIAGDGSLRAEHERLAARLLPAGRFRFVGRLAPDALAQQLGGAGVYLSASRSDSTSLSLLEAMACGAVPVVSDIAGNREWVDDGEGARLFAPGDAAAVTRAVDRVLDEPAWADAARRRNRRTVEERGDWSANMGEIEALFEALARGAPLPAPRAESPGNRR
jgi:glycosyltransferase involved in cell wall biosynthesis